VRVDDELRRLPPSRGRQQLGDHVQPGRVDAVLRLLVADHGHRSGWVGGRQQTQNPEGSLRHQARRERHPVLVDGEGEEALSGAFDLESADRGQHLVQRLLEGLELGRLRTRRVLKEAARSPPFGASVSTSFSATSSRMAAGSRKSTRQREGSSSTRRGSCGLRPGVGAARGQYGFACSAPDAVHLARCRYARSTP
jgi:hypothetical protein